MKVSCFCCVFLTSLLKHEYYTELSNSNVGDAENGIYFHRYNKSIYQSVHYFSWGIVQGRLLTKIDMDARKCGTQILMASHNPLKYLLCLSSLNLTFCNSSCSIIGEENSDFLWPFGFGHILERSLHDTACKMSSS